MGCFPLHVSTLVLWRLYNVYAWGISIELLVGEMWGVPGLVT